MSNSSEKELKKHFGLVSPLSYLSTTSTEQVHWQKGMETLLARTRELWELETVEDQQPAKQCSGIKDKQPSPNGTDGKTS